MSKKVVASFDGDEEANKEISEVEAKQNSIFDQCTQSSKRVERER